MFLKFILALLPIIWLIVAMSILKWPGYRACFMALVVTIVIAVFGWKLSIINTATAALEGICNALWPIIIVILAALFTYNLTVIRIEDSLYLLTALLFLGNYNLLLIHAVLVHPSMIVSASFIKAASLSAVMTFISSNSFAGRRTSQSPA